MADKNSENITAVRTKEGTTIVYSLKSDNKVYQYDPATQTWVPMSSH